VVTGTGPCFVRRQGEVLRDQYDARDKTVPELVCHGRDFGTGGKKGGDRDNQILLAETKQ
jgi:hypothetical protein